MTFTQSSKNWLSFDVPLALPGRMEQISKKESRDWKKDMDSVCDCKRRKNSSNSRCTHNLQTSPGIKKNTLQSKNDDYYVLRQ